VVSSGTLPVNAHKIGKHILVGELDAPLLCLVQPPCMRKFLSSDQRDDRDRQVARVSACATTHGHSIDRIVTEVGSGLNGKRRKVLSLLADPKATTTSSEVLTSFCADSTPSERLPIMQ